MIFKCKVCGGDLDLEEKSSIGTCKYCGTKQTLPRLDDDKRRNLYERANHFRRQSDFDKAAAIYDTILNEDRSDAEAYWSLVLCKYGVQYVEDPATKKRIPTCSRTQFSSVLADEDYKQALEHADQEQRILYTDEAKIIDGIQKGILEVSSKEEPFDIFICYKETDANNRRTPDSVWAQDMYHQLTQEGFKVFFARITLEGILGTAYEPYIFAALQSAKVMIVLGSKAEYFNAIWVKNEWSRYQSLIKGDSKKVLIPAYRDMDPYDLPDEFSQLQALDMGKLGFIQDLLRGIKKIISPAQAQGTMGTAVPSGSSPSSSTLMQRGYIELEDGNWQKADSLFEQVLNTEPQNSKAYIGKLMAERGAKHEEDLAAQLTPLSNSGSYQKALRFADEAIRLRLEGYEQAAIKAIELQRKQKIYSDALAEAKRLATCERSYEALAKNAAESKQLSRVFGTIPGFEDANDWVNKMIKQAEHVESLARNERKRVNRVKMTKRLVKLSIFLAVFSVIGYFTYLKPTMAKAATMKAQRMEQQRIKDEEAAAEKAEADRVAKEEAEEAAKKAEEKRILAARMAKYEAEKESKYPAAQELWNAGKYREAKEALNRAGGYKFGKHKWRILDIKGDKALLVSFCALSRRQFSEKDPFAAWQDSSIRKYLNGSFFNSFSSTEKARIIPTKLPNNKVGKYGGETTEDSIFMLSKEEVNKYFKEATNVRRPKEPFKTWDEFYSWYSKNEDRTAFYEDGDTAAWYLRSIGRVADDGLYVSLITIHGDLWNSAMFPVNYHDGQDIRPAMWISLK